MYIFYFRFPPHPIFTRRLTNWPPPILAVTILSTPTIPNLTLYSFLLLTLLLDGVMIHSKSLFSSLILASGRAHLMSILTLPPLNSIIPLSPPTSFLSSLSPTLLFPKFIILSFKILDLALFLFFYKEMMM